uniref:Uncharacterized protein n=1 Tax=viral metagenome TaxID=1070528 RepID=A0A6M3K038_9ZZZZ
MKMTRKEVKRRINAIRATLAVLEEAYDTLYRDFDEVSNLAYQQTDELINIKEEK